MGIKPVELYQEIEKGQKAVGVRINGKANLQELLDAWQPLCDDASIYKKYAPNNYAVCRGCKINCCNTAYVMPDLIALKKMAEHLHTDYQSLVAGYMQIDKTRSGIVQMKLPCAFLNECVCSIYPVRSLICRFYICTDIIGSTQQLIYSITLTGIAASCVWAEKEGLVKSVADHGQSSFELMFKRLLDEYRHHEQVKLFLEAQNYEDIPLEPFLSGLELSPQGV
jgi:hypothetical protein